MTSIDAPFRQLLSFGARVVHQHLYDLSTKKGYAHPFHRYLADLVGRCVRSIRYYLAELQAFGLVKVTSKGLGRGNDYHVFHSPTEKQPGAEAPPCPTPLFDALAETPEVQTSAPEPIPVPVPSPVPSPAPFPVPPLAKPSPSAELVQELIGFGLAPKHADTFIDLRGEVDSRTLLDWYRERAADKKNPIHNPAGYLRVLFNNPEGKYGFTAIDGRLVPPGGAAKKEVPVRTLQDSIENMDHQRAEEGVRQAELARQKKLVDDFHKMPGFVQQKWRDKAAAEQPVLKGLSTLLEQAAAAKAACHSGVPKL